MDEMLISACTQNDSKKVETILNTDNKLNIHHKDDCAIRYACYYGYTIIVKLLLEYYTKHNEKINMDIYGTDLFRILCEHNRIDIIKYLLKYCEKNNFNMLDYNSILICVHLGHIELLRMLLNYRWRINVPLNIILNKAHIYSSACPMYNIVLYDEYIKYLIKYNYKIYNAYGHTIKNSNKYYIYTSLCIHKKFKSDKYSSCKYIYNNNKIIKNECIGGDRRGTYNCKCNICRCKIFDINYILLQTI